MPKVSIIIPVYNAAPYLSKCIESILSQTLHDIEILLIDDGSTDGGGAICDEYRARDERIKVFHTENHGVSMTRNFGIDHAGSPYIMFADADDWVDPEFCRIPYQAAIENNADLVLFTYCSVAQDGSIVRRQPKIPTGLISEAQALQYNVSYGENVWLCLYRRELFEGIRYPVGKYYEDTATSYRLIHKAERIVRLSDCLYNYRLDRKNSITTSAHTKDHSDIQEMFWQKVSDFISWGYEDFAVYTAYWLLTKYGCRRKNQKPFVDVARRGRTPEFMSRKQKIMLVVLRISPPVFDFICFLKGKKS